MVDESSTPASRPAERRTHAKRLAVRRLEAALVEQARLGDAYSRSISTSAEQSCYVRLAAATVNVSRCDGAVKLASTDRD